MSEPELPVIDRSPSAKLSSTIVPPGFGFGSGSGFGSGLGSGFGSGLGSGFGSVGSISPVNGPTSEIVNGLSVIVPLETSSAPMSNAPERAWPSMSIVISGTVEPPLIAGLLEFGRHRPSAAIEICGLVCCKPEREEMPRLAPKAMLSVYT